jgi:transcriptional adapter 3
LVLSRTEEEGVGLEDLDTLQLELETLLSSVNKRLWQLDGETQILNNYWQEKKDGKKSNIGKGQPQSPGKRGKPVDEKPPIKKFKDSKGEAKQIHNSTPVAGRPPKGKNAQTKPQDFEFADSPTPEAPRVPKNDAPNRFWAFVEPYCAEITTEDVKLLETLIRQHDEDGELYKIPALGKHYSLKWAQEDMIEEQDEGSKASDKKRGVTNNNVHVNSFHTEKLLKKGEKEKDDDSTPLGSLTQKLVSCLIEENLMSSLEDAMTDTDSGDATISVSMNRSGFIRSLSINNASHLERRIKRELEEQGILDLEDMLADSPDDEILAELRKCQLELRAVSTHNLQVLKQLLRQANEEMARQELRKKMQLVDAEVMEAYRRITACRQKKKSPTKKEKDHAVKALKERESIIKSLEEQ